MTYQRPSETKGALRLHLNENTAGCSPAVIDAIRTIERDASRSTRITDRSIATCEQWLGVEPGWVQLVNGLDEGLHSPPRRRGTGCRSHARPEAVIVEPAFEMYVPCAEAAGLTVVRIPPQPAFAFPMEPLLAAISAGDATDLPRPIRTTRRVSRYPPELVEQIAESAPNAIVLVDEAYADFSGRTQIGPPLDRRRNLIVGRTFAKAHGLAGLRAGALASAIRRRSRAFDACCRRSASTCAPRSRSMRRLQDRPYLDWFVAQSVQSRDLIYDFCRRLDLPFWRSEANFVLVRVGSDAAALVRAVVGGVTCSSAIDRRSPDCDGCIRITAGVVEHTRAALTALEAALASRDR